MGKYIKKEEQPWIQDGRWYHFFIESDGEGYNLTTADISDAEIKTSYIFLPLGYHIVDMKYDVHSIASASSNITMMLRFDGDGRQGITLPPKAQFDYADFWIFAHKGD